MKETKEALVGIVALGKFVADRLKDGVQLDDAVAIGKALTQDGGNLKPLVEAGYKGSELIKEELQDLNVAKVLDVAAVVPRCIDIISGNEVIS